MKSNRRSIALFSLAAMLAACSAPSESESTPGDVASPIYSGAGGSSGSSSSSTTTTAGSGGACPDVCSFKVEPRSAKSPLPTPYTGIPPVPCGSNADCQAVAECRHTACDMDCGFCMFVDPHPCLVDGCPGHNSTCIDDADCSPSAFYATKCQGGRCLVQHSPLSSYHCKAPGEPKQNY